MSGARRFAARSVAVFISIKKKTPPFYHSQFHTGFTCGPQDAFLTYAFPAQTPPPSKYHCRPLPSPVQETQQNGVPLRCSAGLNPHSLREPCDSSLFLSRVSRLQQPQRRAQLVVPLSSSSFLHALNQPVLRARPRPSRPLGSLAWSSLAALRCAALRCEPARPTPGGRCTRSQRSRSSSSSCLQAREPQRPAAAAAAAAEPLRRGRAWARAGEPVSAGAQWRRGECCVGEKVVLVD